MIETAPTDRKDVIERANQRIAIYQEFAPKQMNADEIEKEILLVINALGLQSPNPKDKGLIMKNLMPTLKGKADGALINQVLSKILS
ncbi:MAG: GatB/YqeY domain-containing protein [Clostridiales bacterium]|nr:GatB/YqeY domain-containing protein [Clostridiales bacterium]